MLKLPLPNGRQSRELEMILVNRREMIRMAQEASTTRVLRALFFPLSNE